MSNLGGYQVMTTLAKKLGGPKNLAILTMGGGYLLFRGVETVAKKGVKTVKARYNKHKTEKSYTNVIFEVTSEGTDKNGLIFNIGDKYKVLELDDNVILIEKVGDLNNPYVVSADFLCTISDFKI